jgi:hypothetical protein
MKTVILIYILSIPPIHCFAQEGDYPVPPIQKGHLFYLQNTRNKNTVVYELNIKDGKLDTVKPVNAYWIRYSEHGQRQDLNFFQRKFAYGINAVCLDNNIYQLTLAANKNFKIFLQQYEDGSMRVFTTINKRKAILTRIFINITGGSALSPEVDYVEISGIDLIAKNPVVEKVKMQL